MSDDMSLVPKWVEEYLENPKLRGSVALVKLIPFFGAGVGFVDEAFVAKANKVIEEREKIFFEGLLSQGVLTDQLIENSEFLHKFSGAYRAAIRTHHTKKIQRFALLLANSLKNDEFNVDTFDEYLNILENLSEREFLILLILCSYENNYLNDQQRIDKILSQDSFKSVENMSFIVASEIVDEYWEIFKTEVEIKCLIDKEVLYSMLRRLEKSGLYQTFGKAGLNVTFPDTALQGKTSKLFADFAKWITLQDEIE